MGATALGCNGRKPEDASPRLRFRTHMTPKTSLIRRLQKAGPTQLAILPFWVLFCCLFRLRFLALVNYYLLLTITVFYDM